MKKFIVDTSVISESIKKHPSSSVIEWLAQNADSLFITSITIEELRFGEFMMPAGKKRRALKEWIDSLKDDFSDSIFDFDADAANTCAKFHEKAIKSGRTPAIEDLMIAAIAEQNNAEVVTRNVKDFEYLGIEVINPFQG